MKSGLHSRWARIAALASASLTVVAGGLGLAACGEPAMAEPLAAVPAIDRAAPASFETASFALG